jgi:hypothetical protein
VAERCPEDGGEEELAEKTTMGLDQRRWPVAHGRERPVGERRSMELACWAPKNMRAGSSLGTNGKQQVAV